MTKPKPKPQSALEAVRVALEHEEQKRTGELKPIEVLKVAFCAFQAHAFLPIAQPNALAESSDRAALRRGTQAAMDRLLFNVNYWRSAYEDRIVDACASKEDAEELLAAICAWNTHTMKLNTLYEPQVKDMFERFCPPLVENNRRGNAASDARGKGPVADFVLQAKSIMPHLSPEKRSALEGIVADVEAEAKVYSRFQEQNTLDALYELLPAWCLQDKIELVIADWWNDADVIQYVAQRLCDKFVQLGHAEVYCTYYKDMVNEALDGYMKELDDVPAEMQSKSLDELLNMLSAARRNHPDCETDGYGSGLPAWLNYKEQLIWNMLVCAIYGPKHARPFMADSLQDEPFNSSAASSDVITSMAKNAYTRYVDSRQASMADAEYGSFDQLPEDLHRSSVERIVSFPEMLKTLGYRIVPSASCYPEQRIAALAPSEIEVLAILEHRRWCEERKAAGWCFAKFKDIEGKKSPYLTEWESLPERAREWNRCTARDIPLLLEAEGLAISR